MNLIFGDSNGKCYVHDYNYDLVKIIEVFYFKRR